MLVSSTSVSPGHAVINFSILGFRRAVKGILFSTISSSSYPKSISDEGFLSDLAKGLNLFFGVAIRGL